MFLSKITARLAIFVRRKSWWKARWKTQLHFSFFLFWIKRKKQSKRSHAFDQLSRCVLHNMRRKTRRQIKNETTDYKNTTALLISGRVFHRLFCCVLRKRRHFLQISHGNLMILKQKKKIDSNIMLSHQRKLRKSGR